MDATEASSSFFQDLENFGNAVGNTLDGLLTSDWDLGPDNDNDISAGRNDDTMARRRIARPLMFYNPVFYYFNRTVKNKDVPKFISGPKVNIVEEKKVATPPDASPSFAQLRRGSVLNVGKSSKVTRKNSHALKVALKDVASSSGVKISRALSRRTTKRRKRSESQTVTREDGNVCTMNSVIATMKTKDPDPVAPPRPPPALPEASPPSASLSPTLQRNKTIRWGGTRKAPGLIREFTLKQDKKRAESDPLQPDQIQAKETDSKASQSPSIYFKKEQLSYIKFSSLLPPAPQLKRTNTSKIRVLLQKLGTNPNNAFGYAVTKFVGEVKLGREKRPLILLHDVRSFMTDIKACLLLNPHFGFIQKIQSYLSKEESRTNVESGAVDDGLERLVLLPLHHVLYQQLVICYHTSGKLKMLEECFAVAKTKTVHELGVRSTLVPPSDKDFETIKRAFVQLQQTYSPYLKLKCLLTAVKTIYRKTKDLSCGENEPARIGADDFLPLFVYSIVKCEFLAADIEAQYIEGLLDQSLLLGEAGYYLTSLISAMQVLFSMRQRQIDLPHIYDLQAFLKVGIKTDDRSSAVIYKTLHVPPNMTSRNLCQMIALKYKIINYQEYCLHVVIKGHAWPLQPDECPQLVKADLMTQMEKNAFHFDFIKMTPNTDRKVAAASTEPHESIQQFPEIALPESPNMAQVDQKKRIPFGKEAEPQIQHAKHDLTAPNHGGGQFYNPLCDDGGSDVGDDVPSSGEMPLEVKCHVKLKREISKIFKNYTGPVVEEIFDDSQKPAQKSGQEDEKTTIPEEFHSADESPLTQVKIVIQHNDESLELKENHNEGAQNHSNDDKNCTTKEDSVGSPSLISDVKECENKAITCKSFIPTNADLEETADMEVRTPESEIHEENLLGKDDESEFAEAPKQKDKPVDLNLTENIVFSVKPTTFTDVGKLDDSSPISVTFQQSPDGGGVDNIQQVAAQPDIQVNGQNPSEQDKYGQNKLDEVHEGHTPHPYDPPLDNQVQILDVQSQNDTHAASCERSQVPAKKETLIEDESAGVTKNIVTPNIMEETNSQTVTTPPLPKETAEIINADESSASKQVSMDMQHDSNADEDKMKRENANEDNVSRDCPSQTVETSKEENELAFKVEELKLSDDDDVQSFTDRGKLDGSTSEKTDNENETWDTSSSTTVESTYILDPSYQPTTSVTANETVRKQDNQQLNEAQQQQTSMQHHEVKNTDVQNETLDFQKSDERVLKEKEQITKSDDENKNITEQDTIPDIHLQNVKDQQLVTPPVEDDDKLGKLELDSKEQTLEKNQCIDASKNKITTNLPSQKGEMEDKREHTVATTSEATRSHKTPPTKPPRRNSPQKTFSSLNTETHKKPTLYLELDENLYRSFCRSAKVSDLKKFFESKKP